MMVRAVPQQCYFDAHHSSSQYAADSADSADSAGSADAAAAAAAVSSFDMGWCFGMDWPIWAAVWVPRSYHLPHQEK